MLLDYLSDCQFCSFSNGDVGLIYDPKRLQKLDDMIRKLIKVLV